MKIAGVFILLLLIGVRSYAQKENDNIKYMLKIEKYKRVRTSGIIVTVAGTALTVLGISTLNHSSLINSTGNTGLGILEVMLGVGGVSTGIPLWLVGGHNIRKYTRKFEGITLNLNVKPQSTGLTLSYRFK